MLLRHRKTLPVLDAGMSRACMLLKALEAPSFLERLQLLGYVCIDILHPAIDAETS